MDLQTTLTMLGRISLSVTGQTHVKLRIISIKNMASHDLFLFGLKIETSIRVTNSALFLVFLRHYLFSVHIMSQEFKNGAIWACV